MTWSVLYRTEPVLFGYVQTKRTKSSNAAGSLRAFWEGTCTLEPRQRVHWELSFRHANDVIWTQLVEEVPRVTYERNFLNQRIQTLRTTLPSIVASRWLRWWSYNRRSNGTLHWFSNWSIPASALVFHHVPRNKTRLVSTSAIFVFQVGRIVLRLIQAWENRICTAHSERQRMCADSIATPRWSALHFRLVLS